MNPIGLIIGNLCSLLAMVTDSVSSTRKTARGVLMVQNLSQLFYCTGAVILKGYSGAVQNAVSILRNFVALRNVGGKAVEWLMVALGVVLGVYFNNLGLVGYLPIVANLEYTLVVFRFRENERALKIAFLVSVALFGTFNAFIYNFVGVVTNAVVLVTGIISLIRTGKKSEKGEA